ncbi:MAG: hypothetical protein WCL10_00935 [Novosphingobium sp.]|uniref:hypothetical protein n=1 Tax=Novosphingobium sp. TaxID=1874826 RepID=UPI003017E248
MPAALAQSAPPAAPAAQAPARSDSASPAPANPDTATPDPALAEANAAIAQRLLQAGQRTRCGGAGADGGIVVCGGREANEKERLPLRDELESARATRDGLARAPNVSGLPDCSRGCIGFGSAPAPMYFFDITKLPEAPPDSDADRIARGEIRAP